MAFEFNKYTYKSNIYLGTTTRLYVLVSLLKTLTIKKCALNYLEAVIHEMFSE